MRNLVRTSASCWFQVKAKRFTLSNVKDFVHKRGFKRHKKKIMFFFVFFLFFFVFFSFFCIFLFFFVFFCFYLFFSDFFFVCFFCVFCVFFCIFLFLFVFFVFLFFFYFETLANSTSGDCTSIWFQWIMEQTIHGRMSTNWIMSSTLPCQSQMLIKALLLSERWWTRGSIFCVSQFRLKD